jgi:uncharacterized protein (DUF885 family)
VEPAARAFEELRVFLEATFYEDPARGEDGVKPAFRADRFAAGTAEYEWALRNNLGVSESAARLYEDALPIAAATRDEMMRLARQLAPGLGLAAGETGPGLVRTVMDAIARAHAPATAAELVEGYRRAAFRLVEYGRRERLFAIPEDYRLEVTETPGPLRASLSGAAYYPAPPFKAAGVGRFFVTPPEDPREVAYAAMANLAAHEGFPGHDWHYKVMTAARDRFGPVRWLAPGAVEDSSSMWQDSLAAEGWGLYAEALLAEPRPGAPFGVYTPEERLFQLGDALLREVRVRVDVGLHTGRLAYDEAIDEFARLVHFEERGCRTDRGVTVTTTATTAASPACADARAAIYRYSKWPTQAITYRLGKDGIVALREEARRRAGPAFSARAFHEAFMRQGPVPPAWAREAVLRALAPR